MTVTMTAAGLTIHHVELSGRRAYVARLAGTDPKYGFERHWADKVKSLHGRRGYWARITDPGWYEHVSYSQGTGTRRTRYYANDGRTLETIPDGIASAFLVEAFTGPPPGSPGAWRGDLCHCAAEIEHYTPAGFPRCADHWTADEHSTRSRNSRPEPDAAPNAATPF